MKPVVPIVMRARRRKDGFLMMWNQLLGKVRSTASCKHISKSFVCSQDILTCLVIWRNSVLAKVWCSSSGSSWRRSKILRASSSRPFRISHRAFHIIVSNDLQICGTKGCDLRDSGHQYSPSNRHSGKKHWTANGILHVASPPSSQ